MHTPGILRWAMNGYRFKKDRAAMLRVFVEGFPFADGPSIFPRLLSGEIPWTEDEEGSVHFTA